jgi:MFS family permease
VKRRLRASADLTFRSLRSRNFRLFFAGQGISQIGTWMQMVATGILVLRLTDSGIALGLATAAQFGPILVLGAWSGLLADRTDRHRLLLAMQACGALAAGVLAALVLTSNETLFSVFALTVLAGVVTALENPARRSFVVDLVEQRDVPNAVGLNSALMTGSRVVGPAVAGALIAGPGIGWCFAVNALSYVPQLVLFARMDRGQFRPTERVARGKGQLREGFRYVWSDPELRLPLLLIAVVGTLAFNYQVVLPLLAERDLGGGATTYTLLFSLMSLGSVAGALVVARRTHADTRFLAYAAIGMGVANAGLAAAPNTAAAALLILPVGYYGVFVISGSNAVVQLRARPAMRGRVLALLAVVFLGSTPIGGPIAGWVSEKLGARAGLLLGAISALGAGLVVLRALRGESRSAAVRLGPREAGLDIDVVGQPENALGDDVALHLAGAAADGERGREQEAVGPRPGGSA